MVKQLSQENYFYYKTASNYFKIPTIVISSIASVASVGLTVYVSQAYIGHCLFIITYGWDNQFNRVIFTITGKYRERIRNIKKSIAIYQLTYTSFLIYHQKIG